ncbi:MAG: hypothetical protein IPN13_00590 [Bacteroidetes bacterium]|nr:hypothetical protein [Bacteroidota bacterium]
MNLGNEKEEGIKQILNSISAVPYFSLLGNEERPGFNARMGFRDLMALVFKIRISLPTKISCFIKPMPMNIEKNYEIGFLIY